MVCVQVAGGWERTSSSSRSFALIACSRISIVSLMTVCRAIGQRNSKGIGSGFCRKLGGQRRARRSSSKTRRRSGHHLCPRLLPAEHRPDQALREHHAVRHRPPRLPGELGLKRPARAHQLLPFRVFAE